MWQYYKDEPFINNSGVIIYIPDDLEKASFIYKHKITGQAENYGATDVQRMVPFKH